MPRTLALLLLLTLPFTPLPGQSDISNQAKPERIYDVEVILFRNESVPRGRETVLPTASPELPARSIDFSNPDSAARAARDGFKPLTDAQLRLKAERQRLDASRRYRVLKHFGWRQPGLAADDTRAIRVRGGRFYDNSYESIDEAMNADAAGETRRGLYELEGWLRVSLSRYLHTEANLVLREPAKPEQIAQTRNGQRVPPIDSSGRKLLINYPLKEKRRMRSKRLHYLDHPEYGLLVLITPYQPAAAVKPAASASGSE